MKKEYHHKNDSKIKVSQYLRWRKSMKKKIIQQILDVLITIIIVVAVAFIIYETVNLLFFMRWGP